jgi:hypothetical protein
MKLKMRMFQYTCGRCGCTYLAAQPAATYGDIVARDEAGNNPGVLFRIGDPLSAQVDAAVARHPAAASVTDRRRGRVIRRVVAHLSDVSPDGLAYDPEVLPACPNCGAVSPESWESVEPPAIITVDLPELSRVSWSRLSAAEQDALLAEEVNDALSRS